jgi:hypothetical protein
MLKEWNWKKNIILKDNKKNYSYQPELKCQKLITRLMRSKSSCQSTQC